MMLLANAVTVGDRYAPKVAGFSHYATAAYGEQQFESVARVLRGEV
jgi:hypothetical protein